MEVVSYNYQREAISLVDIYPVVKTFERAYAVNALRNVRSPARSRGRKRFENNK